MEEIKKLGCDLYKWNTYNLSTYTDFKRKNQPRETGMEHTYSEDILPIYLGSYSMPIFTSNLLGND